MKLSDSYRHPIGTRHFLRLANGCAFQQRATTLIKMHVVIHRARGALGDTARETFTSLTDAVGDIYLISVVSYFIDK